MKIITSTAVVALLAITACAAPEEVAAAELAASIELDIAENTAGDYAATKTFGLDVTGVGDAFAGIEVDVNSSKVIVVDEWHVGMTAAAGTVSLGKQGNVWLDAPSAAAHNTIADPALGESIQVTVGAASVGIGFDDIETNMGKIDNLQGMYTADVGIVSVTGAVDYNMDTEKWTTGARLGAEVGGYASGVAMTYAADAWAYEADATVFGITAYLNGTETNEFQHIGGKYVVPLGGEESGATVETSVNYDLDDEDISPALNLTFAF
tara:strand:- start:1838 stop:2635 length:798 start_codon:yes stop_codon:yes gene_type:complete